MTFELSELLLQDIIHSLENQEKSFLVDAESGTLVEKTDGLKADDIRFYEIPSWTSEDGFKLRENFVNDLHAPLVQSELKEVLHSGRGVFRNFRNVVKSYPEVDKLWHIFKNTQLLKTVNNWYNTLREVWGLEKLDQLPESDENLVHDDFTFSDYNPVLHEKSIILNVNAFLNGNDDDLPSEVCGAFQHLWRTQFDNDKKQEQTGFVCHSLSDEFAGCILVKSVSAAHENVMLITNFFVSERYRGLGLGTELLSMCVSKLSDLNKKWLILPNIIIPEIIKPLLDRTGFKQTDFGYVLQL